VYGSFTVDLLSGLFIYKEMSCEVFESNQKREVESQLGLFIFISLVHIFLFFFNIQNIYRWNGLFHMSECIWCRCDGVSYFFSSQSGNMKDLDEVFHYSVQNHLVCRGPLALPRKHRAEVGLTCFQKRHTYLDNCQLYHWCEIIHGFGFTLLFFETRNGNKKKRRNKQNKKRLSFSFSKVWLMN
jgi:hypothetical protein